MTPQTDPLPPFPPNAVTRVHGLAPAARHARRPRARAPAMGVALMCLATLCAGETRSHKARPPKAASSPSTAQILAPSSATTPDALPPDKVVYRCGNSYSARPCAGAGATPLAIADARTDAQRRQSAELTARDKRLAAWYEAGRRERETVASAPAPGRRASATGTCVDTAMMSCVPKKPRTRIVLSSTTTSPPMGAKGKN